MPDLTKVNTGEQDDGDEGTQSASNVEQTGVPADQVSSLVSEFRQSLEAMRKAAPTPAPTPAPVGPTKEETQAKYKVAREKANELAAAGDYAGSLEVMYETWTSMSQAGAQDVTQTPAFKALRNGAKRDAKRDHAELFTKYGPEIEAAVAAKPAEQQIDPDAWDNAIREVQLNHFDEILDAERTARATAADERAGSAAVVNSGSRGRATGTQGKVELSADEVAFASQINFTPERYANAKKRYIEHASGGGRAAILDEAHEAPVAPGKF